MDEYAANEGRFLDRRTSQPLSSIEVNSTKFEIGMTYEEVLATGYRPTDEEFANEHPNGLCVMQDFENEEGKTIVLGFANTDYRDDSQTVSNGGYLYKISPEVQTDTILIDGIREYSSITEIIDVFGEPESVDIGLYKDYPDLKMTYMNDQFSQYLNLVINLDTGKITRLSIEGYTE